MQESCINEGQCVPDHFCKYMDCMVLYHFICKPCWPLASLHLSILARVFWCFTWIVFASYQVRVRIGSPITGYGQESRNRAARQRIPNRVYTDEFGIEHVEVNVCLARMVLTEIRSRHLCSFCLCNRRK